MPLTTKECQKIIFNLGIKFGVSPKLISERLLNDLDKDDMRLGSMGISSLEAFTEVWIDNGMPDYAHGKFETYEEEKRSLSRQRSTYHIYDKKSISDKPFVEYTAQE